MAKDSHKSSGEGRGGVGCPLRSLAHDAGESSAYWRGIGRCVWRGHDFNAPASVRERLHVPLCIGWDREIWWDLHVLDRVVCLCIYPLLDTGLPTVALCQVLLLG